MKRKPQPQVQPKTRNVVAIAAWLRGGAGSHGGSAKAKNRRDRRAARRALKGGGE